MGVMKVAGIETEYGITVDGAQLDPVEASCLIVSQWREGVPLDAASRSAIDGTDRMLPNGARLYVDHAHPEYSAAEALHPRTVLAADKAGEAILDACRQRVAAHGAENPVRVSVYKNNTDHQGHSYGCHENYAIAPATYDALVYRGPTPARAAWLSYLVTRTVLCGAGKVGSDTPMAPCGFQLSQRADYFERLIGLQTTYERPLINTRDEPHADPSRVRRLHVIVGDANMAEYSTLLKVGMTQLVLAMLDDGITDADFALQDPLVAFRQVSRDLSFTTRLPLASGASASAIEIQRAYLAAACRFVASRDALAPWREILALWDDSLERLAQDWAGLSNRLDWALKRRLLERVLARYECEWDTVQTWQPAIELTSGWTPADATTDVLTALRRDRPEVAASFEAYTRDAGLRVDDYWAQRALYYRLRRLDLDYHELNLDSAAPSLFYRLQRGGAIERLLTDEEVEAYVGTPPRETRAYVRGGCIAKYGDRVQEADWGHLIVTTPAGETCVELPDPSRGTPEDVGTLFDGVADTAALLTRAREGTWARISRTNAVGHE